MACAEQHEEVLLGMLQCFSVQALPAFAVVAVRMPKEALLLQHGMRQVWHSGAVGTLQCWSWPVWRYALAESVLCRGSMLRAVQG